MQSFESARGAMGIALISALLVSACGGSQQRASGDQGVPVSGPWFEVRFHAAALPARRASGAAWHQSGSDGSAGLIGGLIGLAIGYPEIGFALGSAMVTTPQPEAPAPVVVLKIESDTYRLSPIGKTLAPRWSQPLAIPAQRYRPQTQALIQILDAIDQGVIGQRTLTVKELLTPGARTLTELGEVASLDLEVRAMPPRPAASFQLFVDGARSLQQLKSGADQRWAPVPVWNGDRIIIEAAGEICPSRPTPCFDANGAEPGRWSSYNYAMFSGARHASLVAVLPGQTAEVGVQGSFVAEQSGFLLLFANDTDEDNNVGGFDVMVTVEPAP